jgi:putative ATP-dependent endonuclease of OLD family
MIKNIEIYNFRSIQELILNPQSLCALLGPNSTGKSNVLKAIDLVLGEGWATKAKVAKELFFDCSKEIDIRIHLSKSIPWNYYGQSISVNTITLNMSYSPLECKVRLWANYPDDKGGEGYYLNEEFKKSCHFIYIPSNRELSSQMRVVQWTLLGKIMKQIHGNYVEHYGSEDKLKAEMERLMKEPKEFLEADFDPDVITFKKFQDTFVKFCKMNSSGLANSFKPLLNIYNLNWFYKTLQITVDEDFKGQSFDAEEVGSGMQNLILLSIFQTYAELMGGKAILAIEEPELYLYPQAQRKLYRTFQELSKASQIFYTTHNPNFVDAARAHEVEMLFKDPNDGTYVLDKNPAMTPKKAEENKFKIYTQFSTERNEIFFAKKTLLVEGDSDKILWTTLAKEKYGIDIDDEGVSIIECGGKTGVIYFIGVCKLLGIDNYFAIWDEDNDGDIEDTHGHLQTSVDAGKGLVIPKNLEAFLSKKFPSKTYPDFSFDKENKVENAYNWALKVKKEEIPKEFSVVEDFLKPKEKPAEVSDDDDEEDDGEVEEFNIDDIPF